jgi:6-pyruvoyl-tetrahydropterin synthase related domain
VSLTSPFLSASSRLQARREATERQEFSWRVFTAVLVFGVALWIVFTKAIDVHLLFHDTTPNGGDTGAHVWWPAYLRDHVFNRGRISGWTPDWYAGFPIGRYYMPVPGILIVLLDAIPGMPYNIAFKLVSALGPALLPFSAYVFARGLKAPWPAAPLMAAATLCYLFFTGYSIWGGNLYSNAAGEFSFTIGLALALFFLGTLAMALDTRRRMWLPAALLGLTVMSHVIVSMFVAIAAVLIFLMHKPSKNWKYGIAIGLVGAALASVWIVPMFFTRQYTFDMGWTKLERYWELLLPDSRVDDLGADLNGHMRWAVWCAVGGLVIGLFRLRRATLELTAIAAALAVFFMAVPEHSRLWNARILPFYYLMIWFLAALGIAELVLLIRDFVIAGARVDGRVLPVSALVSTVGAAGAVASLVVAFGLSQHGQAAGAIHSWYDWNNYGYEAKAEYPEYNQIMTTMAGLGAQYGCGRALWDPNDAGGPNFEGDGDPPNGVDRYGTSLALELIPYFTGGCIGSMEGLYFESSGTTPWHFITLSQLAQKPSNPIQSLTFGSIKTDFDRGITHMRMLGVKYFMAIAPETKEIAATYPADLQLVAQTDDINGTAPAGWDIYLVKNPDGSDVQLVEALTYQPIVLGEAEADPWARKVANDGWFLDRTQLDRMVVEDGPAEWTRADAAQLAGIPKTPLAPVTVSNIRTGEDWIRFDVSEPGVPVLVKMSDFPNFVADGAEGPWRAGPNMMVVVPTSNTVTVRWGQNVPDDAGRLLSVLGLIALIGLARWKPTPLTERDTEGEALLADLLLAEPGAAAGLGPLHPRLAFPPPWEPPSVPQANPWAPVPDEPVWAPVPDLPTWAPDPDQPGAAPAPELEPALAGRTEGRATGLANGHRNGHGGDVSGAVDEPSALVTDTGSSPEGGGDGL